MRIGLLAGAFLGIGSATFDFLVFVGRNRAAANVPHFDSPRSERSPW